MSAVGFYGAPDLKVKPHKNVISRQSNKQGTSRDITQNEVIVG